MRTPLVIEALQQAAVTRGSLKGAVFHTDHGSGYTSKAFAAECKKLGVTQSMRLIHRVYVNTIPRVAVMVSGKVSSGLL